MSEALPIAVTDILNYLAAMAQGYGNQLKWNEVAKLKADVSNVPERWSGLDLHAIAATCEDLGMRQEDADTIATIIRKSQRGQRLVAHRRYRSYRFSQTVSSDDL